MPYLKDYLDHEHPQAGNPNAILFCGVYRTLGRAMKTYSLYRIYTTEKQFFPKLLDNPNVSYEDKQKVKDLLRKPWIPYAPTRIKCLEYNYGK